jgi:hypothetical protein
MKIVSNILVGKIMTHMFYSTTFFPQIVPRMDDAKKNSRADQTTGENMTRLIRITRWISKVTNPHSEYEVLLAFPQKKF